VRENTPGRFAVGQPIIRVDLAAAASAPTLDVRDAAEDRPQVTFPMCRANSGGVGGVDVHDHRALLAGDDRLAAIKAWLADWRRHLHGIVQHRRVPSIAEVLDPHD